MAEKTINPYLVLAAALIIPGSGHLLIGKQQRGLVFLFFMLVLGWTSWHVMPETGSFVLRHAGALLVYGLSVLDAYRIAKVKQVEDAFQSK